MRHTLAGISSFEGNFPFMGVLLRVSFIEIATTCHYVLAWSGIVHERCKSAYHPRVSRYERVGARESMKWPDVWRNKNEICPPF
jgi:hypothetical protein